MKQHLLNATLGTLLTGTLALSAAADGPEAVWGSATITIQNGQAVITASDGTVLDWQSLMVAPWETLEFNLPDGESAILNRVLGGTPTDIQGSLLSNGHVYIVNPAGVVFGADAVVDCGALYAVAGNMSLDDWMQGLDRFELTGEVTNHGHLQGNKVGLLGQRVLNHGTVQAGNGLVALVAGDEVLLWESGGRLHAKIDGELLANTAGTGQAASDLSGLAAVENTGSIQGGSVLFGAGDAFALALNNQGLVQANTAEFSAVGGGVVLGGMIEGQPLKPTGRWWSSMALFPRMEDWFRWTPARSCNWPLVARWMSPIKEEPRVRLWHPLKEVLSLPPMPKSTLQGMSVAWWICLETAPSLVVTSMSKANTWMVS